MTRPAPNLERYTVDERGCWLWAGSLTADGYARVNGRLPLAHKLNYERHRGPIPAGRQLVHTCGAKHCINPEHLAVTEGLRPEPAQDDLLPLIEVDLNSGCWLWTGAQNPLGYGRYTAYLGGKRYQHRMAHRVFYEVFVGRISGGLQVCHRCDTPPCCNPAHLFLGTAQENAQDREAKGRAGRGGGGGRKLSEADVVEIRSAYLPGDPERGARALARRYGVLPRTIRYHASKS